MSSGWLALMMSAALVTADPVPDAQVVDDFESCRDGYAIAPNAQSRPWLRFGDATMNEVIPTSDPNLLIDGRYSARYDLKWPGGFAKVRRAFTNAVDLSAYEEVFVRVKSDRGDTDTTVTLDLSDGRSTCVSRAAVKLTSAVQEVTFLLSERDLEVIDGPATVSHILTRCSTIGLHFQSSGKAYTESVVFDDVTLNRHRTGAAVTEAQAYKE